MIKDDVRGKLMAVLLKELPNHSNTSISRLLEKLIPIIEDYRYDALNDPIWNKK